MSPDPGRRHRRSLDGLRILVSAGPTREHLDPVRFISNPSSGRMGYAIARACRERGAKVVLVTGPVELAKPKGMRVLPVVTAREMLRACAKEFVRADAFVACAAVSDFRPVRQSRQKKKKDGRGDWLELRANPDILLSLSRRKQGRVLVGFAAETQDLIANAESKLRRKRLDLIVANSVAQGRGFGADDNRATLLEPGGHAAALPLMSKRKLAGKIATRLAALIRASRHQRIGRVE